MLFDSHAHLNHEKMTNKEKNFWIEKIRNHNKLEYIMDIGFDLASSKRALEHAQKYNWCYAAVGVHPHDTDSMTEAVFEEIKEMAYNENVKAIGEIGLDFHYDFSDRENQRYWFRRQIQLANLLKKPIVIHSREADLETMQILKDEGAFSDLRKSMFPKRKNEKNELVDDSRVLIHCFSGSYELAQEYVKLGATIGICGPVTFKNNRKTVQVVKNIPIEYLTIETDSPYLTPEPFRGKPNNPTLVEYVAYKVAEIKEMKLENVEMRTYNNAKIFFDIK